MDNFNPFTHSMRIPSSSHVPVGSILQSGHQHYRQQQQQKRLLNDHQRFSSSPSPSVRVAKAKDMQWRQFPVHSQRQRYEIKQNFIAWLNGTLKPQLGRYEGNHSKPQNQRSSRSLLSLPVEQPTTNLAALYILPNNVNQWTVNDVAMFVCVLGYPRAAMVMVNNLVDGIALLLMRRYDFLNRVGLPAGEALKLYELVQQLHGFLD